MTGQEQRSRRGAELARLKREIRIALAQARAGRLVDGEEMFAALEEREEIRRALEQGDREIAAGRGYSLEEVLAEAEDLVGSSGAEEQRGETGRGE